jgi:glycosyltransferase involved in cell wall biosynthesis
MASVPLRILLEQGSFDTRTGAFSDTFNLASFVRPMGVQILFCGPLSRDTRALLRSRGLDTVRGHSRPLSKFGFPLYALSVFLWVMRLLRLRPHVVHLNYVGWAPSLACAAYLCGIPVVARAGSGWSNPQNLANRWIQAYAATSYLPHAKVLLETPLADRVYVLGDLFQPSRLREPDEPVRPVPPKREGRPRFLFLGQLVERKGIAVLVEAFARMKVDADLFLVGGNWEELGYPRYVRGLIDSLRLGDRVHLENHRGDVAVLMRRCDVFVLPTLSDARPLSIIEAMSMGLPVIASRVGGIPTLVEDGVTGLLVTPSDPNSLAAALDRLAASPDLRRLFGEAGRARVAEQCQPERSARRCVELYRGLLEQGPLPDPGPGYLVQPQITALRNEAIGTN